MTYSSLFLPSPQQTFNRVLEAFFQKKLSSLHPGPSLPTSVDGRASFESFDRQTGFAKLRRPIARCPRKPFTWQRAICKREIRSHPKELRGWEFDYALDRIVQARNHQDKPTDSNGIRKAAPPNRNEPEATSIQKAIKLSSHVPMELYMSPTDFLKKKNSPSRIRGRNR